jgi:Ribonuclease G/E
VSMRRRDNRHAVINALREAVKSDRCPVHIAGFTRFGLIEMTRERRRASLSESLLIPCADCGGTGFLKSPETVAYEALRDIQHKGAVLPAAPLTVTAPSHVIAALKNLAEDALAKAEDRIGWPVNLVFNDSLEADQFQVWTSGEVEGKDG